MLSIQIGANKRERPGLPECRVPKDGLAFWDYEVAYPLVVVDWLLLSVLLIEGQLIL